MGHPLGHGVPREQLTRPRSGDPSGGRIAAAAQVARGDQQLIVIARTAMLMGDLERAVRARVTGGWSPDLHHLVAQARRSFLCGPPCEWVGLPRAVEILADATPLPPVLWWDTTFSEVRAERPTEHPEDYIPVYVDEIRVIVFGEELAAYMKRRA